MRKLGVYIHIPFCVSKCVYCAFFSRVAREDAMREYVNALLADIKKTAESYRDFVVDTLYLGGGTPNALPKGCLGAIADAVRDNFVCDFKEFSVEVNPSQDFSETVSELKKIGCNRVSVGAQSLNDDILEKIGRKHNSAQTLDLVDALVGEGFDVSCDIILGLEGQRGEDITRFVEVMDKHGVGHISAYGLSVEPKTILQRQVQKGEVVLPDEDTSADFYDLLMTEGEKFGFCRYEISNFAKGAKESIHNSKYWQGADYLGIGAGSHSKVGRERFFVKDSIKDYIYNINNNIYPYTEEEFLDEDEALREKIILGLRLCAGIDIAEIEREFNINFKKKFAEALEKVKDYIEFDNNWLRVKGEYMAVLNQILVEFV